ncbi:MAG TPA: sugar phosphate isomerase/epimerase family protein [Spirochaetia bacterium]|nr:sugar phosphate isomerase/epimerase family protein [Spirochaetia bacterium]
MTIEGFEPRFGVSPAYFISRFSDTFTPSQVAMSLVELREMGYRAVQLEVFHRETLEDWERGGAELVASALSSSGLAVSQFVAHFLLHGFESPAAIGSAADEIHRVLDIIDHFPDCRVVTLPLGEFRFDEDLSCLDFDDLYARYVDKLAAVIQAIERKGLRCAIELLPGAFINGTDGLARLFDALPSKAVGYNFDTGHAHASRENVGLIPFKLKGRVLGTHLCDNDRRDNLSLRPGAGSIQWKQVFEALHLTGYTGGFDIEIRCSEDLVEQEYRGALELLREIAIGGQLGSTSSDQDKHSSSKEYSR